MQSRQCCASSKRSECVCAVAPTRTTPLAALCKHIKAIEILFERASAYVNGEPIQHYMFVDEFAFNVRSEQQRKKKKKKENPMRYDMLFGTAPLLCTGSRRVWASEWRTYGTQGRRRWCLSHAHFHQSTENRTTDSNIIFQSMKFTVELLMRSIYSSLNVDHVNSNFVVLSYRLRQHRHRFLNDDIAKWRSCSCGAHHNFHSKHV